MAKETISQTEGLCKEVANCIRIAYEKGYKQGQKDMEQNTMAVLENGKMIGREEAWECAKKIVCYTQYGGLGHYHLNEIFGIDSYSKIFLDNSASEAIEKIKVWEKAQQNETKGCNHCKYENLKISESPCRECTLNHDHWESKQHKEIKIGDKVRTTQDRDYNGNVLFSVGTIGVIKKIDKGSELPYQVATKDSMWEWWYSEDMLEVIRDDEITIGDEVICYGANSKSIVVYIERGEDGYTYYKCLNKLLGICTESDRHKPVKTGKHFERIDEIYKRFVEE